MSEFIPEGEVGVVSGRRKTDGEAEKQGMEVDVRPLRVTDVRKTTWFQNEHKARHALYLEVVVNMEETHGWVVRGSLMGTAITLAGPNQSGS